MPPSGKTVEQGTKAAVVPSQKRTLQSTRERIPFVLVPKTVPQDEECISGIPVPQAMEGLAEAINWRVAERTDEKTVEVPQVQSVDKAVGAPVGGQRQVPAHPDGERRGGTRRC